MNRYAPFERGDHPVGVYSQKLTDPQREGRVVELECWYPATARHRGQDLTGATQDLHAIFGVHQVRQAAVRDAEALPGRHPLVLFSHGIAGHRRQSSFFCTHLASHGYVVLAPDHGGGTFADLVAVAMRIGLGALPTDVEQLLFTQVEDRPRDLGFVLDQLDAGALVLPCTPDRERVGATGHSFGGFTALALAARDDRVHSVVAMAPAGGAGLLSHPTLTAALRLDFEGRVSTLYLANARDTLLPLEGIEALYRHTSQPARMFVLPDADHMHFCDRAEGSHEFLRRLPPVGILRDVMQRLPAFSDLVPAAHGYAFANALGLAQLDATLRQHAEAAAFFAQAEAAFAARGIVVREVR
jgi:dienelactone hydrolase